MMLKHPMNYKGFGRWSWHPVNADLNCSILMLRMIMLMLRMSILYILYKEWACDSGRWWEPGGVSHVNLKDWARIEGIRKHSGGIAKTGSLGFCAGTRGIGEIGEDQGDPRKLLYIRMCLNLRLLSCEIGNHCMFIFRRKSMSVCTMHSEKLTITAKGRQRALDLIYDYVCSNPYWFLFGIEYNML
jgi:hypothetical protein